MASSPTKPADTDPKMRLSALERLYRQSILYGWQLRGADRSRMRAGLQDPGAATRCGVQTLFLQDRSSEHDRHPRQLCMASRSACRRRCSGKVAGARSDFGMDRFNQRWQLPHWQPDLMGERLAILALNYGWYGDSADEAFQAKLARSVEMQLRSLAIDWRRMKSPDAQITALAGIALAEAALGGEAGGSTLLELLHPKLETLVLADGGHISRMPDRHISLLRKLVEIRMATSHAGADATRLSDVMNRMGNYPHVAMVTAAWSILMAAVWWLRKPLKRRCCGRRTRQAASAGPL